MQLGQRMGPLLEEMSDLDISGKYLVNSSSQAARCSVIKVCVAPSHFSVTSDTVSNIAKLSKLILCLQFSNLRTKAFYLLNKIDDQAFFPSPKSPM